MASFLISARLFVSPSSSSSYYCFPKKPSKISVITCGPRDNRGPLVRGRVLSTEAMLAVQALKRARGDDSKINEIVSKTLIRLIKQDLLASLRELLRQDQCHLALKVFMAVHRELWYKTDYSLYAEMVSAMARNGMMGEIDSLVSDLEEEGFTGNNNQGLTRLLKALIAAGRAKSVVKIIELMKRGGSEPDEYLYGILSRGLKRLGEAQLAMEVEKDFVRFSDQKFKQSII
eukprot:TRINITY_DN18659_c0_g1_i1.p1 TRINITY_DN18659_c0_g1~~TRINITY_DN18659_c0_g1_i1.p1  ORF type:complete len:231 (-),score=27.47 TRINITY_DN18659_c0_g1_i1:224-916(-)